MYLSTVTRALILFLIFYMPLDAFLLKWIPMPERLYLILGQIPDVLLFCMFVFTIIMKSAFSSGVKLIGFGIDKILVIFLIYAFGYAVLVGADLILVTLNIKALLRYILVVYLIMNINLKDIHINRFWKAIQISIGIQVAIGIIQIIFGPSVSIFFLPRITEEEVGGVKLVYTSLKEMVQSQGISGTMIRTIEYALLIMVGLVFWMINYQRTNIMYWVGIVLSLVLIYWSGSRAIFLVGFLLVIIHQYYIGKLTGKMALAMLLLPFIVTPLLFADINFSENYIIYAFSDEYIQIAKKQRLGIILVMLPEFFKGGIQHILFGYSPDPNLLFERFLTIKERPSLLMKTAAPIEDVYWVALLYYYGVIGISIFILFIYRIWRIIKKHFNSASLNLRNGPLIVTTLLLITLIPLNFFNQAFEVKHFSFVLWLCVGITLFQIKNNLIINKKIG